MAKEKKPKIETRRGLSPVGMASFPNLFTPKKINENDPKEEPKFRLTHVYKVANFSDANRNAFNQMVENVNTVCRLELLKTFADFTDPSSICEYTAEGMITAFEAALVEHEGSTSSILSFAFLAW
jgi:hypothetical protein